MNDVTSQVTKFEAGKTYTTRSACDSNCIISMTVEKRTAKTITANVGGERKTFRVAEYRNTETVKPWGAFSMAPVIAACDATV